MAVNDVYRVEIFQNVGSELTMNVLHVRETVSETILDVTAEAVVEMVADLYTAMVPNMSEDWRVVQITARRVTGGIPSTLVLGAAESIVGTVEAEIIPSSSALLISLYSDNPAKTGRGRQYIPGLPETAQNEGQLTEAAHSAFDNALQTAYKGEKGPFLAGDGKFRFTIWAPNSVAASAQQDVSAVVIRPNLATQRSRRAHPGFA